METSIGWVIGWTDPPQTFYADPPVSACRPYPNLCDCAFQSSMRRDLDSRPPRPLSRESLESLAQARVHSARQSPAPVQFIFRSRAQCQCHRQTVGRFAGRVLARLPHTCPQLGLSTAEQPDGKYLLAVLRINLVSSLFIECNTCNDSRTSRTIATRAEIT